MKRALRSRWPGLRILFALAFCLAQISVIVVSLVPVRSTVAVEQVSIFMVALDDNGQSGIPIGCGDSLVPVTIQIPDSPTVEGKITAALEHLFSLQDPYYGQSGLYNALYENSLVIDEVSVVNGTAGIILSGGTGSRGVCDEPRIEGQIAQTALQFSGVDRVEIILNGGPLGDYRGPMYFPETGHRLHLAFLDFWLENGDLPVFGYPITDQLFEDGFRVQYLQRQRFESHPENSEPYQILLGLLGREIAEQEGLLGTPPFQPQAAGSNPNCEYFPQTGHHLCFGFRGYWHSHGLDFGDAGYSFRESLVLFGYPISEEFVLDGRTVQYFERARLEWHPENSPPWDVLLGLLGTEVYQGRPS